MRETMGWTVAAVVVAAMGCGGSGSVARSTSQPTVDEHQGPDVACGQCAVTGGGQLFIGTQRVQLDVQAIPESGPSAGPGVGGGVAAHGHVSFQTVPASTAGGLAIDAAVDTIVSCSRERGVLRAVVSGTVAGDGRFTAVVTDGGEPAHDTFAFTDTLTVPATPLANGNLQVHTLDRCDVPCGEGLCLCPDDHVTCEVCQPPPPAPPPCASGLVWNPQTQACERPQIQY